jgi:penicillin amidase
MELLGARDQHSLDDMAAIQFDSKDVYASEIVPALLQLKPADARAQQALGLLQSWDFQARRDRVGEALFSSWYVHLLRDTYGDELGTDLSADYLDHRARNQVVFARTLADPASPWWDDVSTPEQKETRAQILERSLNEALHELAGQLGDDMSSWTWGRLHTATFENESLGQSNALGGLLKRLLNRGPVAVDGGFGIVNATNWSVADPYAVTSLPSLRALYDLSDFNRSRTVHTTGQSGHPYNAHYDDFTTLWANGQYHEQWWDRTAVEQNAEGHLVLGP